MADTFDRLKTALADRYAIQEELGAGGMATVYLAEDLKHHRKVAVKVLRPELAAVLGAERFVKEIETTANLQHPHILPLFDSGEADSFLYYVMPFIDGESLRDKLDREKQLGVEEAVKIATEVADALDSAHQQGVIHRDIKPENILLHNGRPMVADFGIALAVSAAAGGRMTETGLSLGTPHYMSPEQATAEKDLTHRSDIYSLGSVFYEMLTGDPPHVGSSAQQIIMKIVTDEPRPVTDLRKSVPPHVAAAVAKSLEKLAADRFESAARFAEALTNPAFTLPTQAARIAAGSASGPWKRLAAAMAGLTALLLLTTIWGWLRPIPQPDISRYSVALPAEEALLRGSGSAVVISQDGARLVYRGAGDLNGRLWVREVDQLHGTPLPNTDGPQAPFLSPDGSRVGFFSVSEQVWRVASLGGGTPTLLADSGVGIWGAAWGSDGYIYLAGPFDFVTGVGTGLVRVPERGGSPKVVTTVDATQGEGGHGYPSLLPGGRGIVFSVGRGGLVDLSQWDIAVADLTTGTHTVLVHGVRAWYAASGHLVYVTADRTLMAAPFDESKREFTGDPVAIVENLSVGTAGSVDLALSATGRLFYGTGGQVTAADGQFVWVRRDGTAEPIDPDWTGGGGDPALSPDGTQLAVTVQANLEFHVWIKQLDRGPLSKLTLDGTNNRRAVWTPDGRSVAFLSNRGGGGTLYYLRRADGAGQAEVLLNDPSVTEVIYSPDGEWLVYRANGESRDLYALRVGGDGEPVTVSATEFEETAPALSKDGRWLAYVSDESGRNEVYVRPFPNTNDGRWPISSDGGTAPVWSHDGTELFFIANGNLMSVDVVRGATFVTGERRVLFSMEGFRGYDVTPDDQRFVMFRRPANRQRELIVVENFFEELKAKMGN